MPQQLTTAVENNFTKGLVTERTGLNFPENAATESDNCSYDLIGQVQRRLGIDMEENGHFNTAVISNAAINSYKWNNAGGDGSTQIVVVQFGSVLYFYRSSDSTQTNPLTDHLINSVSILNFATELTPNPASSECQFADGNGFLFVYHPNCDPFYCSYTGGVVSSNVINLQIRDFVGTFENVPVTQRPDVLTNSHLYNLTNQGWTLGSPWFATSSTTNVVNLGSHVWQVQAGLSVTLGDLVSIQVVGFHHFLPSNDVMSGTVTGYSGTTLTVNVTGTLSAATGQSYSSWSITPADLGHIDTWHTQVGNYPSNADVWWYFKDSSDVYSPGTTANQRTLNSGPAPKGHYTFSAFSQNRSLVSGVSGLTLVETDKRPRTGTWFQGRVWYTGVDDTQAASGTANVYTWTENIYFSQVVITPENFGQCYQSNDPTSDQFFDLLPTDGGVISIQGCGPIHKLFPIQNGMLVFAANGVWFITGSQGIGFTANDYTITKISSIESISSTSFVDVQGLPYFWNEEGIYKVAPQQGGSLSVESVTVSTILDFFSQIPMGCKKYARGAYHPIDYTIQWAYRDTDDNGDITARYQFNKILNFNSYNQAFYPYTISGTPNISGLLYVSYPGGDVNDPLPVIKYVMTIQQADNNYSFAEERDEDYVDWRSYDDEGVNYESTFTTGYRVRGQAIRKFQVQYLNVVCNTDEVASGYKIQGIWNYANSGNSGKWTTAQTIVNGLTRFDTVLRRHKIRGSGYTLQFKITSIDGMPFNIIGWSVIDTVNQGA